MRLRARARQGLGLIPGKSRVMPPAADSSTVVDAIQDSAACAKRGLNLWETGKQSVPQRLSHSPVCVEAQENKCKASQTVCDD